MRSTRIALVGALVGLFVAASGGPAGAQQLVDASGENGGGGLAFVCMVVLVFLMGGAMFLMDRVRRRRFPDEE